MDQSCINESRDVTVTTRTHLGEAMAVQDGRGEDPGEAIKARYLAKCVQRSSVVLHAVYGHIRCPSTFDVVLGKVRQGPLPFK